MLSASNSIQKKEINPYETLGIAVIEQAIKDWYLAMNYINIYKKRKDDGIRLKKEIERFFKGPYYCLYSGNAVPGEKVLEELELQWERGKRDWKSDEYI